MARWLALLVLLAVIGVACEATSQATEGRVLTTVFPGFNRLAPLPVVVDDRTGMVVGVAVAGGEATQPDGPDFVPGLPNAVAIRWLGGTCDHRVVIVVSRPGRWLVDVRTDRASSCTLAGISRAIVLAMTSPIDPTDVDVVVDGRPVDRRSSAGW